MKYAEQILNNESARCMLCAEAPCTAACPEGFDPARFVRAVRFENAAVGAGYVSAARCAECSGECESACLHYESPVKIREMIKAAPEPVKAEELTADLSMEFCGVKCENPFFLSSSVVASGYEMCANALRAGWGGIVYKTIGFIRPDEVSPRFDAIGKESTPFVGFKNLEQISDHPLKENLEILRRLKREFPSKVIVSSIMGSTEEEWTELARLSEEAGCDIIECNFSCPQMVGEGLGSDVGQNPELVRAYTAAAKRGTKLPVLAKMTPNIGNMEVFVARTKYPQGAEKTLIKRVMGRIVPSGGLPADVGVVVDNISTVKAISDAIQTGMPLVERVATVTGEKIKNPGNFVIKIGTSVRELIDYCGGFTDDDVLVKMGGPMMGFPLNTLDVPMMKGSNGIIAIDTDETKEQPCIKCGRCVDVCPMELSPLYFVKYAKEENWQGMKDMNVMDCVECRCCQYICSSKIPIINSIKAGKNAVRGMK